MTEESSSWETESPDESEANFFARARQLLFPDPTVRRLKGPDGWVVMQKDKLIWSSDNGRHNAIYYDRRLKQLCQEITDEGPPKRHEVLVRYDIGKLGRDDYRRAFWQAFRIVRPGDPKFQDLWIEFPKQKKEFPGLYRRLSNQTIEPDQIVSAKLNANFHRVKLDEWATLYTMDSRFWGPDLVFRGEKLEGLIWWTPRKEFAYLNFELYGRLHSELLLTVKIPNRPEPSST